MEARNVIVQTFKDDEPLMCLIALVPKDFVA
jgi:hypothetical protein